jgi:hypothetical protein
MSLESMIHGLSKWRESTSTSPSNKHLGLYKALIQHYHYTTKQQTNQKEKNDSVLPQPPTISLTALKIQHQIINLAITHTHSLERWKDVHNFFIEKVPGLPLLDKLRVIHLYEADWNLIIKYFFSHQLTHLACKDKTVSPEQAGGRCGRSASSMATKTIITHEICRLQRLNGAVERYSTTMQKHASTALSKASAI